MAAPDQLQFIFFAAAAGCYFLGFILLLLRLKGFSSSRLSSGFRVITGGGTLLHLLALVTRIHSSGHLPVMKNYENILTGSFVCMLAYLIFQELYPRAWRAGLVIFPFTQLLVLFGIRYLVPAQVLSPIYRSNWLVIHIFCAWLSFALYTLAAGASVAILYEERERKMQNDGDRPATSPRTTAEDGVRLLQLNRLIIRLAFLFQAAMVFSGAVWADLLWGQYWSWDAVELISLISWLTYGLYIHMDLRRRLTPRYSALYLIIALLLVVVSFFGVAFFNESYHSFENIDSLMR